MTDWNSLYQDGTTPWDKGEAAPPLLDLMERHPFIGRVLVPGCGAGHDVRAIAELGKTDTDFVTEVVGLDLAPLAIERAEKFATVGCETYVLGDWFDLANREPMAGSFDRIWEHTCFCAIDLEMRDSYVAAAHSTLVPGGEIWGVFYLDPYDGEHQPGGGPPHGTSVEELHQRFAGGGHFEVVDEWCPERTYAGREGLEWVMRMRRRS